MAAVEITISGVLYDKLNRTTQQVVLIGEATYTGIGVGGGPMPGGRPPHVSGGPIDPYPDIGGPAPQPPPGAHPEHPIYYPPNVPPSVTPPTPPSPGDPTTTIPGNWPVQPIAPPPYLVVQYPGIGPVVVAPPLTAQPKPA
jgi:hypothetical protein